MDQLCQIKIDTGARYISSTSKTLNLKPKDWCVIRRDKVLDYGQIVSIVEKKEGDPCPSEKDKDKEKDSKSRQGTRRSSRLGFRRRAPIVKGDPAPPRRRAKRSKRRRTSRRRWPLENLTFVSPIVSLATNNKNNPCLVLVFPG